MSETKYSFNHLIGYEILDQYYDFLKPVLFPGKRNDPPAFSNPVQKASHLMNKILSVGERLGLSLPQAIAKIDGKAAFHWMESHDLDQIQSLKTDTDVNRKTQLNACLKAGKLFSENHTNGEKIERLVIRYFENYGESIHNADFLDLPFEQKAAMNHINQVIHEVTAQSRFAIGWGVKAGMNREQIDNLYRNPILNRLDVVEAICLFNGQEPSNRSNDIFKNLDNALHAIDTSINKAFVPVEGPNYSFS